MQIDEKFVAAVHRMEKRTNRVAAYVVIDPRNMARNGRVVISYPADGAGRLYVVAWLPGGAGEHCTRHARSASGYGHDKASAAMSGARFTRPDGEAGTIDDNGTDWKQQLTDAGFRVFFAV